ncbi:MAG: hypothetical protein K9N62_12595 [Verrucomicrobia bacterium]|jgi:hypothetical protein|nr:hypothetical protein [Verrucomicrobiota bacterium]
MKEIFDGQFPIDNVVLGIPFWTHEVILVENGVLQDPLAEGSLIPFRTVETIGDRLPNQGL